MSSISQLLSKYVETTGQIEGTPLKEWHLEDLRGCFADKAAYEAARDFYK